MLRLFSRRPDYRAAVAGLTEQGIAVEARDGFAAFLEQAEERELYHLNPRYLGERLNLDERTTLRLLVAALYSGVVTLHWDVRCPACGAIDHRSDSLTALHHDTQCQVCRTPFAPALDNEVRVTFSLHQRLRSLSPTADNPDFRAAIDSRLGPVPGQALLVLPAFQRLFPQQRLLPDESLNVSRVALVFTDLAGSTALYARRGDPRAYYLVRLHFDELFRVADDEGGTIIKTIGDAIMAAFQSPAAAFRAALAMHRAIAALNNRARLEGDERLILKLGMHCGPCLSVTLNDRPDYFGSTVNIAARVQGLSAGNDIFFTEPVCNDSEVQPLIGGQPLQSAHVRLKGIDEDVLVHCMQPA